MAKPKVKIFRADYSYEKLESEINDYLAAQDMQAEDIINISFSKDASHYLALMTYKV